MRFFTTFIKLNVVLLLLFSLSGCWDYQEISYVNYATSLGIDYKDGEFTIFVQMLNFASIGKQEGQVLVEKPIVVGKARGKTITDAFFALYRTEQLPIFWGHVTSLVFKKEALERVEFKELIDIVNRYRELRYNIWVYGTENSIEELYNLTPFFGLSPYDSILMNPTDTYKQYSDIKPVYLFQFLAHFLERGRTAVLPIISYNTTTWKEGRKESTQMTLKGAYFFDNDTLTGKLEYPDLYGKRYLDKNMKRLPITIYKDGKPLLSLIINVRSYKVKHTLQNGKVLYDLEFKIKAYINEMYKNLSETYIQTTMKEDIEKQIRWTFEKGREMATDVYNLNDTVYRHDYKNWKTYIEGKPVDEIMELRHIKIDGVIQHSGKYKYRIKDEP